MMALRLPRRWLGAALVVTVLGARGYPIDGYEHTGIGRREAQQRIEPPSATGAACRAQTPERPDPSGRLASATSSPWCGAVREGAAASVLRADTGEERGRVRTRQTLACDSVRRGDGPKELERLGLEA